jgi:hypothetical protein
MSHVRKSTIVGSIQRPLRLVTPALRSGVVYTGEPVVEDAALPSCPPVAVSGVVEDAADERPIE